MSDVNVPLREAAGVTIDVDDDQWRPLTGDGKRDLTPMTQTRMQQLAYYLWEQNSLANRLIELPVAYILAEGVALKVPDPDAQKWIDAFWNDPINKMNIKLVKKVRELSMFGEQCWPTFVNEHNGHVRLGYVDPGSISHVVADPDNAEQPVGVVTKKDVKGRYKKYRVIVNGPESIFTERTQSLRDQFDDGDCFYFAVNDLSNGSRGRSDILAQIDWLDAYDQFLFGEIDRTQFMRAFMWDITLEGATKEEVEARAREIRTPSPGSNRVHNEKESWQAISPSLNAYDNSHAARLFRNHILGGGTMPEHWFGGGGDVNRSTAGEMGEPTFKMFTMRQRFLGEMLVEVATYVIRQRLLASRKPDLDLADPIDEYQISVEWPELTAKDTSQYAAALTQAASAAVVMLQAGLLTEETALQMVASMAQRLGVEIDPEAELVKAREQQAKRDAKQAAADLFGADQ